VNTKNTTETTGPRQPRPVYYEPDHDGDINDMIAGVLHLRGYRLTSDESWLAEIGVHAMVTVEHGRQYLHDGDTKRTPSPRAGAAKHWPEHAKAIGHYTRKIQEQIAELSRLSSGDPSGYRSGSPATTAAQVAKCIAEDAERLERALVGGES